MQVDGSLSAAELPSEIVVERPKNREHGDWATNAAMQLAGKFDLNPRAFAELLAPRIEALEEVSKVDIAGPGFINITLNLASAGMLAKTIVEAGSSYGKGESLTGLKMNLEFVSANPTGPIHMGGTRWAAVGDSLARVLALQGAQVTREYYFNDHGEQIDRFARSLLARARGLSAPEDGYGGQYIEQIAKAVLASATEDIISLNDEDAQEAFRSAGVELMFQEIRQSLQEFGVEFDVYFHENSLHDSKAVERAMQNFASWVTFLIKTAPFGFARQISAMTAIA
jgi:arginyl-tRNA synthetase (EC 6.1.1.19)